MNLYRCFLVIFLTFTSCTLLEVNCKSDSYKRKDVVVVGGGIAGMAAARRLLKEGNLAVKVLEAQKTRYGGRIWTYREGARGVRGVDVDIGASFLNTKAKNNSLIKMAEEFELDTASSGNLQIHFVEKNGEKKVYFGDNATDLYTEVFKLVIKALDSVKKEGVDRPVIDVMLEALDFTYETDEQKYDKNIVKAVITSLPVAVLHNFSSLLYRIENDFGWDKIVLDGMGALLDRIVAGSGTELPVKIELNKVVRNIKIDSDRKKVLIRTVDRKQIVADAVIVALPIGVLQNKNVIFEPDLPAKKKKALQDIGLGYNTKVVVGFDKAFWPKDVGTFNVFSELASYGFLQTWTNAYRLSGNPFLIGNIFSSEAKLWESKPKKLKELVIEVLSELFGAELVKAHEIKTFIHSNWSTDEFILGSVSYPKTGNTPEMWTALQEPICPYIYFAGAYTETVSHVDSLHGAYNSGVRAAEQYINRVCKKSKESKKKQKKQPKEDAKKVKKMKSSKGQKTKEEL
ncbi:uncharacterized protein LOC132719912 [Ruditapes philippinarum]|uniref:uncharacterized protein LOC132719912 n=1 Tax=Ruditapes philippinarum TaxID=129788 RepID=UPI00295A986A|nr:uncharacterized protein LOC132719912 [Ruditapes philippinarum]